MAYPTVDAPYGLKPVKMISGSPYTGVTRQYRIASAYNTNIFYGDVVKLVNHSVSPSLASVEFTVAEKITIDAATKRLRLNNPVVSFY